MNWFPCFSRVNWKMDFLWLHDLSTVLMDLDEACKFCG